MMPVKIKTGFVLILYKHIQSKEDIGHIQGAFTLIDKKKNRHRLNEAEGAKCCLTFWCQTVTLTFSEPEMTPCSIDVEFWITEFKPYCLIDLPDSLITEVKA